MTAGRDNNWRYLQPPLLAATLRRAQGFSDAEVFGDALQSGGIHGPTPMKLAVGRRIYRFFGSQFSVTEATGAWHGAWWITEQCLVSLVNVARQEQGAFGTTASRFLFVPREWSDLGNYAVGLLEMEVWALMGKGKFYAKAPPNRRLPNAGFTTEAEYAAFKQTDRLYGHAPPDAAYQLFIPGDASEFRGMMKLRTGRTGELI